MILTLTPNAAVDTLLFIDRFVPTSVMRPRQVIEKVGGKGLDSSVALAGLGQKSTAITFLAGQTGRTLLALLEGYGILTDPVWLNGETRRAFVIIEQAHQRHSHIITPAGPVPPAARQELLARFQRHLPQAKWVITGGSLPPGLPPDFYQTVVQTAGTQGVPVLVDTRGEPARSLLDTPPAVLKMNRDEFAQTFGPVSSWADLPQAAADLVQKYRLPALVVTGGRDGLLVVTRQQGWRAAAPPQHTVNAAGAGDAASAALAWRLSKGAGWDDALRWAAAVSAASVLTAGTAECRLEDVYRLLPQVVLDLL